MKFQQISCYIIIFLFLIHQAFTYSTNGYEIRDLEGAETCFLSEVSKWGITRTKTSTKITICNGDYLLGGYGVLGGPSSPPNTGDYFSRSYTNLPAHVSIHYTITIFAIDTWEAGDSFVLDFDGYTISGPSISSSSFPGELCGRQGDKDLGPIKIYGRVSHSASSLLFKIKNNLNEDTTNESFGFRDLHLLFVKSSSAASYSCNLAPITIPNQCNCPEGQYQSSGYCLACDTKCSSCFNTYSYNCFRCAPGSSWDGQKCFQCDASCKHCSGPGPNECITCQHGLFLFQNSTCIPECPAPFKRTTDGCNNYCETPCTSAQFLFWNSTCLPTCPFPLQQITTLNSVQNCVYPCGKLEYLYWDGSCEPICPYPLKPRIESGVQYCDYMCNPNQFLYWDGSCSATCDPPLVQTFDKGFQFCNYPCEEDEFLYYDRSCLSYCDSGLVARTWNSRKFCEHPCGNPAYFIYADNSCKVSCSSPLYPSTLGRFKYCSKACPNGQYLIWNGTCISSCESPLRVQVENQVRKCLLPCKSPLDYYHVYTGECHTTCDSFSSIEYGLYLTCRPITSITEASGLLADLLLIPPENPGTGTFVSLTKWTQYIRYMDIKFPRRLEMLAYSRGRNIFSLKIGAIMSKSMQESFTKYSLPPAFQGKVHSSFLVNFWLELTSILIVLSFTLLNLGMTFLARKNKWKRTEDICMSLRFITMWNLMIMLIAISIGEIIIYTSLEFQTYTADSSQAIFSLLVCLVMFGISFAAFVTFFLFASRAQAARILTQTNQMQLAYKIFAVKWQGYQVLFRGFKHEYGYNYMFFLIYVVRLTLPSIVTAAFYSIPVLQAFIYFFISIAIITYLVWAKPILDKINRIQLFVIETLVMITTFCVLILINENEQDAVSEFIGDLVIIGNVCINLTVLVFLVLKVCLAVKNALRLRKQQSKEEKAAWLRVLFVFLQQGGMGFEQAEFMEFSDNKITTVTAMAMNNQSEFLRRKKRRMDGRRNSFEESEEPKEIKSNWLTQNMNEELVVFNEVTNTTNKQKTEPVMTEQVILPAESIVVETNQKSVNAGLTEKSFDLNTSNNVGQNIKPQRRKEINLEEDVGYEAGISPRKKGIGE